MNGDLGVVLTGGTSRRLGTDKALLRRDGETLAVRAARVLVAACPDALEVGPGHTSLPCVREVPPGAGPLAALVRAVEAREPRRVVLLAVDLPNVDVPLLELLTRWPDDATVVPVVAGAPQPVCARYGPATLDRARELRARGEASLRAVLAGDDVVTIDESVWGRVAPPDAFADVDERADVWRLGLEEPR